MTYNNHEYPCATCKKKCLTRNARNGCYWYEPKKRGSGAGDVMTDEDLLELEYEQQFGPMPWRQK